MHVASSKCFGHIQLFLPFMKPPHPCEKQNAFVPYPAGHWHAAFNTSPKWLIEIMTLYFCCFIEANTSPLTKVIPPFAPICVFLMCPRTERLSIFYILTYESKRDRILLFWWQDNRTTGQSWMVVALVSQFPIHNPPLRPQGSHKWYLEQFSRYNQKQQAIMVHFLAQALLELAFLTFQGVPDIVTLSLPSFQSLAAPDHVKFSSALPLWASLMIRLPRAQQELPL